MPNAAAPRRHKVVDYIRRERQLLDSLGGAEGVAQLHFTFQARCCAVVLWPRGSQMLPEA